MGLTSIVSTATWALRYKRRPLATTSKLQNFCVCFLLRLGVSFGGRRTPAQGDPPASAPGFARVPGKPLAHADGFFFFRSFFRLPLLAMPATYGYGASTSPASRAWFTRRGNHGAGSRLAGTGSVSRASASRTPRGCSVPSHSSAAAKGKSSSE